MVIRVFHPIALALYGCFAFLLILAIAPIKIKGGVPLELVVYFCASYLMFFLGCIFFYLMPRKKMLTVDFTRKESELSENFTLNLSILLALFGVLARIVDRTVLRGVSVSQSAFENRELLANTDSSLLSMFSAILFPIAFISMFLYLKQNRNIISIKFLMIVVMFFYPTLDALLFGSRSLILVNFLIFFSILYGLKRIELRILPFIFYFTIAASLLVASGYIFLSRLEEMGLSVFDTIHISGYARLIGPSAGVEQLLSSGMNLENTLIFSWLNFCQYYLHGFFEFGSYLTSDVSNHSYGTIQFNVIYKVLEKFGPFPPTAEMLQGVNPKEGVFTTFFGPAHMDFSYFSMFYIAGLGYFSVSIYNRVVSKKNWYFLFYSMLSIVIFFMPVVNFIQSAQGLYVLISVIVFDVIYKSCSLFLRSSEIGEV